MQLSFRSVLAVNLAPIGAFTVLIMGVTAAVLGRCEARIESLQASLAMGTLGPAELESAGGELWWVWVMSLATFFLFAGSTSALSVAVYRHVARRAERLASFLCDRTGGCMLDVATPEVVGDDALARLERSVIDVAELVRQRDRLQETENRRSRFDARLQRALDLADTEEEALDVALQAMEMVVGEAPFEMLFADSSDAHLRSVAGSLERPSCPVGCPRECAAIRRGQTMVFGSSRELDACPKLRHRPSGALSAACAPVTVMGRTIGVVHTTGAEGAVPGPDLLGQLEAVATHVGTRVSALRTLASTELRAQTDPMTNLPNRRSFEAQAGQRMRGNRSAVDAVVMVDIDHFKRLNDTAGHEAGDRALRLFANTLRAGLREKDLVARYGGEEFVLLLLDCDEDGARVALDKVRSRLSETLVRQAGPRFTASFGVACTDGTATLEDLLSRADAALYEAKRRGRDRVVTASEPPASTMVQVAG